MCTYRSFIRSSFSPFVVGIVKHWTKHAYLKQHHYHCVGALLWLHIIRRRDNIWGEEHQIEEILEKENHMEEDHYMNHMEEHHAYEYPYGYG